jgi:hypothetical protein
LYLPSQALVGYWLLSLVATIAMAQAHTDGVTVAPAEFTRPISVRNSALGSDIVVTITPRVAGAIHSVTWNGREFIDSFDHGRQLQSAVSFDAGSRFSPETFNPTEAGSRNDGRGDRSTSRLLKLQYGRNWIETRTQMAFWLAPGQSSNGVRAKNTELCSQHLLNRRVTIGFRGLDHVLEYETTFIVPASEGHRYAQFEAVTGYMPPEFSVFWKLNPTTGRGERLSDGPGEQALPVVLSTPEGSHAMGVYSPDQPAVGYEQAGYGRWRFAAQRVTKWNCVFRVRNSAGIRPGDYRFRSFVVIGNLRTVVNTLSKLDRLLRTP